MTPAVRPKNEWASFDKSKIKLECVHKIIIAKPGGLDLYKAVVSPIFAFIFLFYSLRVKVDAFLNRSFNLGQNGKRLNVGITFLFKCGWFFGALKRRRKISPLLTLIMLLWNGKLKVAADLLGGCCS